MPDKIILPASYSGESFYKEHLFGSSTSMTQTNNATDIALGALSSEITLIKDRMTKLEKTQKPETDYFKYATMVQRIALYMIFLLPILQLTITIVVVKLVLIESTTITVFLWIIGGIGLTTILEIVYLPRMVHDMNKRLKKLEGISD